MTTRCHRFTAGALRLGALGALGALALAGCGANETSVGSERRTAGGGDVPAGLTVEARRVTLATPATFLLDGEKVETARVVEFVVTASEPFPVRALDPVLAVGKRWVREYRYEQPNRLVFTEPEPDKLVAGAAIGFTWASSLAGVQATPLGVTFDPKNLPDVRSAK